jgi:hypothetical protein
MRIYSSKNEKYSLKYWNQKHEIFVRSNTGVVGSNPIRSTNVFMCLCCPVQVTTMRQADPRPRSPTDFMYDS